MNSSSPVVRSLFALFWVLCVLGCAWLYSMTLGSGHPVRGHAETHTCTVQAGSAGPIHDLSIRIGSQVDAGQILGQITGRDLSAWESLYKDRASAAQTSTESARRSLTSSWDETRAQLQTDVLDARDLWLRASRDLQSERAELHATRREVATLKGDLKAGFGQKNRLGDLQREVVRLHALVRQDVQRVETSREARRVAEARLRVWDGRSREEWVRDELARLPQEALSAREKLLDVRDERKMRVLRSPCAGQVTSVFQRNGTMVVQGTQIAEVMSVRPRRVTFLVPEGDRRAWTIGARVEVSTYVHAFGQRRSVGEVMAVAPGFQRPEEGLPQSMLLQNRSVRKVYVSLPEDTEILPGEGVQGELLDE